MNPIKTTIFYLSLFIVSFFWLNVFMALFKDNRDSKIVVFFSGLSTISTLALSILLSYHIPYSIWWLMNYWRW